MPEHEYQRDPQSGAGNCVCGATEDHRRHPHEFRRARASVLCVCALRRRAAIHDREKGENSHE